MKVGNSSLKAGKRKREETGTATSFVSFDPKFKRFPRTPPADSYLLRSSWPELDGMSSLAAREAGKTE